MTAAHFIWYHRRRERLASQRSNDTLPSQVSAAPKEAKSAVLNSSIDAIKESGDTAEQNGRQQTKKQPERFLGAARSEQNDWTGLDWTECQVEVTQSIPG